MMEFNSTRNYTVLFTSVLRDCVGSVSTSCQVKLNIVAVVTTIPSPTTTTTPHTLVTTTFVNTTAAPSDCVLNTSSLNVFNSMFWICVMASILLCFFNIVVAVSFIIYCLSLY